MGCLLSQEVERGPLKPDHHYTASLASLLPALLSKHPEGMSSERGPNGQMAVLKVMGSKGFYRLEVCGVEEVSVKCKWCILSAQGEPERVSAWTSEKKGSG